MYDRTSATPSRDNSLGVTSGDHSALAEMALLPAKVTGSGKGLCSRVDGDFGAGVTLDIAAWRGIAWGSVVQPQQAWLPSCLLVSHATEHTMVMLEKSSWGHV